MPPKTRQVKQIMRTINQDPALLDQLLNASDENARKGILERRGLIERGEHGPTRAEAQEEIVKLIGGPAGQPGEERMVEWVAAIGTAAAGAGAAFCAAE